jgi:hypothetical protein
MSKNMVKPDRRQMTTWQRFVDGLVRLHARKHKPVPMQPHPHIRTSTQSPTHTRTRKYVIITAFPMQQWFHEGASVLRCTYIACPVYVKLGNKQQCMTFAVNNRSRDFSLLWNKHFCFKHTPASPILFANLHSTSWTHKPTRTLSFNLCSHFPMWFFQQIFFFQICLSSYVFLCS